MAFPRLQDYLARLPREKKESPAIWLDRQGRAQGRYFSCTLTSAFQPVRRIDTGAISGYEAFIRSYAEDDPGLSLWKLLDQAASDNESIELDRLCRMLHAINFFRQSDTGAGNTHGTLYLSVHGRLLAAVGSGHGEAFRKILEGLGLPVRDVVLQLPQSGPNQKWLATHVAASYRRNGFRIALNASGPAEAMELLNAMQPNVLKVDTHTGLDEFRAASLIELASRREVQVIFKRVENPATVDLLRRIAAVSGLPVYAQGYYHDQPAALLLPPAPQSADGSDTSSIPSRASVG